MAIGKTIFKTSSLTIAAISFNTKQITASASRIRGDLRIKVAIQEERERLVVVVVAVMVVVVVGVVVVVVVVAVVLLVAAVAAAAAAAAAVVTKETRRTLTPIFKTSFEGGSVKPFITCIEGHLKKSAFKPNQTANFSLAMQSAI
jgi:hypothetical protein